MAPGTMLRASVRAAIRLEQAGLGLQLLDLGLDQGLLLAQQRQGVVHGLPFQIVFDLLHGKIQPAQVPDDVELVHVLQII